MDATEFKQHFLPHHPTLYRLAYRLTADEQDAEDLLQKLYLRLWQRRDRLPDEADKLAYLATALRNIFLAEHRRARYAAEQPLDPTVTPLDPASLDERIDQHDEAQHIRQLIDRLPERERHVAQLYLEEGRSYEEIEQATGIQRGNLRIIVMRTRQKLKLQIENIRRTWTS